MATIRVIDFYEPYENLHARRATIIETLPAHYSAFQDYLTFMASGAEEGVYEIDYGTLNGSTVNGYRDFEALYGGYDSLQGLLLAHVNTTNPFASDQYDAISVSFPNGDVAHFGLNDVKDVLLSIAQIPFLLVVDENGQPIFVFATNGAEVTETVNGGGGAGGYTVFTLPDGVLICYGECPLNKGYVRITREEE